MECTSAQACIGVSAKLIKGLAYRFIINYRYLWTMNRTKTVKSKLYPLNWELYTTEFLSDVRRL
jgi:hypothetical protein